MGKAAAKSILKEFKSIQNLREADVEALKNVKDIGEVSAGCIRSFFEDETNRHMLERLRSAGVNMIRIEQEDESDCLSGLTFVITGTLPNMDRKQAAELVEKNGGRVSGSVSKKTSYLLAGENAGSKLTKAETLGIPVISEEEFLAMI